jgi:hypothetical protein
MWHAYMRPHVNAYINTHAYLYVYLSVFAMSTYLSISLLYTHTSWMYTCTQAVSVDAAEGKETIIAMDPKANLLQRRSRCAVAYRGCVSSVVCLQCCIAGCLQRCIANIAA